MFGRRYTTISPEGWYYLFVLSFIIGGALLREINLLLVLAGMMLGPFLYNWYSVIRSLRGLTVRRRLPEGVCAGDLLVVDVQVTNERRRGSSWAVIVDDRITGQGGGRGEGPIKVETLFPQVAAGQTASNTCRGRFVSRGKYRFGPLRISTRFPLGLVRRRITLEQVDTLVVCPRLGRLLPAWTSAIQTDQMGTQGSQRRHGLMEGDFHGLRDWRSGDSRRWIHWRTSARRGGLAVRQFEQQRNQDVALLLDLCSGGDSGWRDGESVETAVSFAATAVADLCRRGGSRLFVGVAGRTLDVTAGVASIVLMQEIMEQLAEVESGQRDVLPTLLDRALSEIRPGTTTVVISTQPVDFRDTDRFAAVWDDPRKRSALGRIVCVNVNDEQLAQIYSAE